MRISRTTTTVLCGALFVALVGGEIASAARGSEMRTRTRTSPTDGSHEVPDGLAKALEAGRLDRAEYALERASTLFDLRDARERFGEVERPDPHDATFLLRELVLHEDDLDGRDRARANEILARPSDGPSDPQGDGWEGNYPKNDTCNLNLDGDSSTRDVCIHWISDPNSDDAATGPFVNEVYFAMEDVWAREIGDLKYRQPKRDFASPNDDSQDGALDIYLADIGDDGLYGYCTTDERRAAQKKRVSAYCVLDNDYDPAQYDAPPPEVSGLDALRVTLAHEFFHAIQFNYDWQEDLFLMEGTAVWMEDQVYDGINAAYAFLFDSALHQPEIPLDAFQRGSDDENFEYGAFVFFTYLSEQKGRVLVRRIFNRAGGTKEGMGAITTVINNAGHPGPSTPYRDFFARWGMANSVYDAFYTEGYDGDCTSGLGSYADVLRCNRPPFDGQYRLGPGYRSTGWQSLPMNRRSNRFVELFPPFSSTPPTHLRLKVDLPRRARGGEATLLLFTTGNSHRIDLNKRGDGSITVPFAGTETDSVLTLSNTGSHDNETYKFKAVVFNES